MSSTFNCGSETIKQYDKSNLTLNDYRRAQFACPPRIDESEGEVLGKVAGFSLHAGVSIKAHQRDKLERLCRYISRPALAVHRLSLTQDGNIRYELRQ
jgi:hypothetical protein